MAGSRCSFIKLKVAAVRSCNPGESAGLGVLVVGTLVVAPEEKAVWILNRAVDTGQWGGTGWSENKFKIGDLFKQMWEEGRAPTSQLRGLELGCGPGARVTRASPQPESLPPVSQVTRPSLWVGVRSWEGWVGWEDGAAAVQLASCCFPQPYSSHPPAHCIVKACHRHRSSVSPPGKWGKGRKAKVQASLLVMDDLTPALRLLLIAPTFASGSETSPALGLHASSSSSVPPSSTAAPQTSVLPPPGSGALVVSTERAWALEPDRAGPRSGSLFDTLVNLYPSDLSFPFSPFFH